MLHLRRIPEPERARAKLSEARRIGYAERVERLAAFIDNAASGLSGELAEQVIDALGEDNNCSVPQIICGSAAVLAYGDARERGVEWIDYLMPIPDNADVIAAAWLLLSEDESGLLFTPETDTANYLHAQGEPLFVSVGMAIDTLERFASTGKIVWERDDA